MSIAHHFMSDVGRAISSSLDRHENWEADASAMHGRAYTIRRISDGLTLWMANGKAFFDLYDRSFDARMLNWWDRRVCWPKAQAIANAPLERKVAETKAYLIASADPTLIPLKED